MPHPTPSQQQAIDAPGNVLVEAAAGAGKTSTLVRRCLARVLDKSEPVSIEHILIVTFTEAAAAELRRRIRAEFESRQTASPDDSRLTEQLALVDSANISTLHSFCLKLVRAHFYELGLDPQLAVVDDAQARLLAAETLDGLLQRHYAGATAADESVQQLILVQGGGWDERIRQLVLRVHAYSQTLPDPESWITNRIAAFDRVELPEWAQWLLEGIANWRSEWIETLRGVSPDNVNAQQCRAALRSLSADFTRPEAADALARVLVADRNWPNRKKTGFREPLEKLFDEAAFLKSLAHCPAGTTDPLAQDWEWVRPHMRCLLGLVQEFSQKFAEAKRDAGAVDFHDLEQFALRLLWDRASNQPTPVAVQCQQRLRLVLVDEYQDINAAQDKIIEALSRPCATGNRFLVGDVKQSIYRFRLANPRIFQSYARVWRDGRVHWRVIPLAENFRSREAILDFVNAVCEALLRPEIGGVDYPDAARLRFGAREERSELTRSADSSPRVELHLRLTSKDDVSNGDHADAGGLDLSDLTNAEKEARVVARRLRELKEQGSTIWKEGRRQPVEWRDMVVLLRSVKNKAESYAKEFARLNVPLEVAHSGFFETSEIMDLLSLLQLLDNPLQDIPALALLRSPLVGLTVDELTAVRLARRKGRYWWALLRFHRELARFKAEFPDAAIQTIADSAWPKVDTVLKSFSRWRRLARQGALSHCLETVLDETRYEDWLLAQPRGHQRRANVQQLLNLTRQFDQFQRQGLFRFLNYVAAQQDDGLDAEPVTVETDNAVRLMSIHQSKGLEFPVVALADLGGRFNFDDLKAAVILDEDYGLCPQVKSPHSEQRCASLPYWLAARHQRREALGEELRLLYVALTRASDRLILTGTASRERAEKRWTGPTPERLSTQQIVAANGFLDWLGPLLPRLTGTTQWLAQTEGGSPLLTRRVWEEEELAGEDSRVEAKPMPTSFSATALAELVERLSWKYPNLGATVEPAKTSVTAVRRRLAEELEEEAPLFGRFKANGPGTKAAGASDHGKLSGAEKGTAHHRFMELARLEQLGGENGARTEAERLLRAGALTEAEVAVLDFAVVAAFWGSELGGRIRAEPPDRIHRELPFTAGMSPADFAELELPLKQDVPADELVVVQGVVDLAVILRDQIWLVDFKTDQLRPGEREAKLRIYTPQLKLYSLALSRIYARPVTERWLHFLNAKRTEPV